MASSPGGTPAIDYPGGGELLKGGLDANLSWTAVGVDWVGIELSRDGGGTWEEIVASTGAAAGSFVWTVTGPDSGDCRLRVFDAADGSPSDTSDGAFGIWHSYKVVDLATGAVVDCASIPDLLSNEDYKTTKLVTRFIPAGTFQMGDQTGDGGRTDELPVHTVNVTRPFYMGVFEVTQRQWFEVLGSWRGGFTVDRDKRPVELIDRNDCLGFLAQLSSETGLAFRMPTEAEWEYACKAGTTGNYSYGEAPDGGYMWYQANSGGETHEVGTRSPNPWGLYDMHGNVWERCGDWYAADYYSVSPTDDPTGAATGPSVVRGGAWNNPGETCRSARRGGINPTVVGNVFGLRAVLAP